MRTVLGMLLLMSTPALAQEGSSAEYAKMSVHSWSAFECAALALASDNQDEADRLFQVGYDNGMTFLYGWKNSKISADDLASIVPLDVWKRLVDGRRPDFILGTLWEAASYTVEQSVARDGDKAVSPSDWLFRAITTFKSKNCNLL